MLFFDGERFDREVDVHAAPATDDGARPDAPLRRLLRAARAEAGAVRAGAGAWMAGIGRLLNVFALFSFLVGLFVLPISAVVARVLDFYAGIRLTLTWPLVQLGLDLPAWAWDLLLFWTLTGAIGARTTVALDRRLHNFADAAVRKADNPEARRRAERTLGKRKFDEEYRFAVAMRERTRMTPGRVRILYVGCIFTGPLFFQQIWRHVPWIPTLGIGGRGIILREIAGLLMALGALFALSWVTL